MDYGASQQSETDIYDGLQSEFGERVGAGVAEFLEDAGSAWNDRSKQVASGSLRGALTGFASGGYPGAVLGAIGGGMAARSRAMATPAASTAPPASMAPAAAAEPIKVAAPAVPATAELPNPHALQAIATMLRPEVFKAFAMMATRSGDTVTIGGREVPVTAIAALIQQLAAQASIQHRQASSIAPSEAYWPEYVSDEADDFDEADGIIELLTEAAWDDEEFGADEDEYEAEAEAYLPEWTQQWPWVPR